MFELRPYNRNHTLDYNPFREMDEFENHFFANPFSLFGSDSLAQFRTDITDNGDSYLLEADLPGFDKRILNLTLTATHLRYLPNVIQRPRKRIKKANASAASVPTVRTAVSLMYRVLKRPALKQNMRTAC